TAERTTAEATDILQGLAVPVPAHGVAEASDTVADPQLAHRDHYRQAAHPNHGMTWVEGPNYSLSRTPSRVDWGGPTFGQHNSEVLEEILGYDVDRIAELIIAGAVA
ncbi:MAG: CoA transferase, partial [Actinomycetota bacterium]